MNTSYSNSSAKCLPQTRKYLFFKGCTVIAEFNCSGEFSPLGFNLDKKGHPDENDLKRARQFAQGLVDLQQ